MHYEVQICLADFGRILNIITQFRDLHNAGYREDNDYVLMPILTL